MSRSRVAFLILFLGTLGGKVLAFLREVLFAGAFGTGAVAGGFRIAQTLSFTPANLVTSDVLSGAFVPSYSRALHDDADRAATLARTYLIAVGGVLSGLTVVFVLTGPGLVRLVAPGANDATLSQAAFSLSVLSLSIPLYGVSAVFAYMLVAAGSVAAQSMRPTLQSVGLIAGTLFAIATGLPLWLSAGFVAAWLVYTVLTGSLCARRGLLHINNGYSWRDFTSVVGAQFPHIATLLPLPFVIQASILGERFFSSLGSPELLAAVDYARTISDSVMSLVAVPLGLLGLTRLPILDTERMAGAVVRVVDAIVLFVSPAAALLVAFAPAIVALVYQRGAFGPSDVQATAQVLQGQSLLLVAQVAGYFLSRALMASGRFRSVLVVTTVGVVAQGTVQALVLTPLGSIALGLGPSVYGVVLSLGFAILLRQSARILPVIVVGVLPAALSGVSILIAGQGGVVVSSIAAVTAWVILVLLSPRMRAAWVREVWGPARSRFLRRGGDS